MQGLDTLLNTMAAQKVANFVVLPVLVGGGFYLNAHDYMGKRELGVRAAVPTSLRPLSSALIGSGEVRTV